MKICSKCNIEKSKQEFHKQKENKGGLKGTCKKCVSTFKKDTYDPVKSSIYHKEKYRSNPDKERNRQLIKNFGITLDDYDKMFNKQEGRCKICNRHRIEFNKALAVDHCHATGIIRGLLCRDCNTGLGLFDDNTETLKKAVNYLCS